jgi:hypothetical protein
VKETGQLAGAETLLDLLLEPPDQEHLAQEVAQPLLREAASCFALDLRHSVEFMLSLVALVGQWWAIVRGLPEGWGEVRLRLTLHDEAQAARASALLGPANPARHGKVIWLYVSRLGGGTGPELVHRLLRQLYYERIDGELELVDVTEGVATPPERPRPTLVEQWDALLAELPADWSDLWAEVELTSSDYLERGALMLAPVNPARAGKRLAYRFRVARLFGYGASEEMARRCLERLDQEGITGEARILHALSDTKPVSTQGPVWYVGGKTV